MKRRTKARVWALQILYAQEFTKEPLRRTFELFFSEVLDDHAAALAKPFPTLLSVTFFGDLDGSEKSSMNARAGWR